MGKGLRPYEVTTESCREGDPPKPVPCEFCGKLRHHHGVRIGKGIIWFREEPEPCTCKEGREKYEADRKAKKEAEAREKAEEEERRRQKRIARIIKNSGMGERFLQRTFDTFSVTPENKRAFDIASRFAEKFDELRKEHVKRNGMIIAGPPGTGKTHLAAAVSNALIKRGVPVICMTMIDLLARIKKTYNGYESEAESDVLDEYRSVPLLVIDDMGKEPPTEWAISTIYSIINGRYENCLPTIVTTNYGTDDLIDRMTPRDTRDSITAEATIDRLAEMCVAVVMSGESWRRK